MPVKKLVSYAQLIVKIIEDFIRDKKFSEILRGTFWALSARLFAAVLALTASVIIARIYGAEMVGILALLDSFLLLSSVVAVQGMDTAALRLIPEHMAAHSSRSAFLLYRKILFFILAASIGLGLLLFFGSTFVAEEVFAKPYMSFYFAYGSGFLIFKSMLVLNTKAVRGLKMIKMFAFMQMLFHSLNVIFLVLLWLLAFGEKSPLYAQLASLAIAGFFSWIVIEYDFSKRDLTSGKTYCMPMRTIYEISSPMLLTTGMTFVIGQTSLIVLGIFRPDADVGYFSVATKLATLTTFILSAVNTMAAPKFAELFFQNKLDDLFYIAQKSAKLIFWLTAPILFVLIIFGKFILNLGYGDAFMAAHPALCILVVGQFANSISGSTALFMNMTGHQNIFRNIMVSAAGINVVFNFILVPPFGLSGAAISATVCMCFWNFATLFYINNKYGQTTGYFFFRNCTLIKK